MLSDLRFAFRNLAKASGFSATIIVTLALSIGACTAIYSVVDSLILNPLDNPDPNRLVTIRAKSVHSADLPVSPADFIDWKNEARSFDSITARAEGVWTLTGEGEPRRMRTIRVTDNYLDVLGLKPALGRGFQPDETGDQPSRVALISHALWQSVFGGQTDVLGRVIRLSEESFTIIGVLPENLERAGGLVGWSDLALPLVFSRDWLNNRAARTGGLTLHARLKPETTVAQAQAEMDLLCERFAQRYPDTNKGIGVAVSSTGELGSRAIRPALWSLLGSVAGVMLIACANVANLLLVRATTRQREISLRTAFGATRSRLLRLLLTESLLLSVAGGVLGTLLAAGGIDLLRDMRFHSSAGLAQLSLVKLDLDMLGVALGLSVGTGLLFGLAPSWLASRCDLADALKQGGRGSTEAGTRGRLRGALLIFEVAASLILLVCAGLLMRSFIRLADFDPGFDPRPIAYAHVSLQGSRYRADPPADADQKVISFTEAVIARLRALPGVESVGVTANLPAITVGDARTHLPFSLDGRPELPVNERSRLQWNNASPDYFHTMGIRLLSGRTFTDRDHRQSPRVAVISETMARMHFAGQDPIGQRIRIDGYRLSAWSEIVGVVTDTVYSYGQERVPQVYEPFAQVPSPYLHFAVRTLGDPAAIAPFLKPQIHAEDPNLAVPWAQTMTQTIGSLSTLARQRFIIQLLGLFSCIALVIALVGIYGVIAFSVSRRTTEIGIRMALGAQVTDVLRLVLGQGARLVGTGLLLGLAGSVVAGRALESMLYRTTAFEPVVLAGVTVVFAAVAALACWLPARRASKIDPMVALRAE
jgi:putative ABC transport system permease protein